MKNYDVIIIGGGPSGAMSGIELQKHGLKTCIIDRNTFPREKLCGGLITPKSVDLIDKYCPNLKRSDYIINKTNSIDFYFKDQHISSFETKHSYFFTDRKTFDSLLIKKYQELGGEIFENIKIKKGDILLAENSIKTSAEKFKYKVLIGADGCNSVLTKLKSIQRKDIFCIEGNQKKQIQNEKDFRIYFGLPFKGYGWHFPKNDHYSIGIGGDNKNKSIYRIAKQFFYTISEKKLTNIKGASIPSGKLLKLKKLNNNTLVVGDSAGFTDPITGEGLYYALLSGVYAAESIVENIHAHPKNVKRTYLKKTKPIRKNIRYSLFYLRILFQPWVLKFFMHYIKKHHSFATFYLEKVLLTYQFQYTNFLSIYLLHLSKYRNNKDAISR